MLQMSLPRSRASSKPSALFLLATAAPADRLAAAAANVAHVAATFKGIISTSALYLLATDMIGTAAAAANVADVAATFKGIIQAIRELAPALKAANVRLFVRRGGPNYQQGLAAMKAMGADLGLPVEVYGPESSMTGICAAAIEYVKGFDK
jgi:succinyl-CoA synthetase beta subunit